MQIAPPSLPKTALAFAAGAALVGALWWAAGLDRCAAFGHGDDAPGPEPADLSTSLDPQELPGLRYAVLHEDGAVSFPSFCGNTPRWLGAELGCARVRPAVNEAGGPLGVVVSDAGPCVLCREAGLLPGDVITHVTGPDPDSPALFATYDLARWRTRLMANTPRRVLTFRVLRDGKPAWLTRALPDAWPRVSSPSAPASSRH